MDENLFFRNATEKICGSLNLETAIKKCLDLLKNYMPAFSMHMGIFDSKIGAFRVYASCRLDDGDTLKKIIPLPAKAELEYKEIDDIRVRIINDSSVRTISRAIADGLGKPACSMLVMHMRRKGEKPKQLGGVQICAEGKNQYTKHHAHLLSLLNEPLAIAVSNAFKHQEVLRLKNLLADDNQYLSQELIRISGNEIIGKNNGLKEVMETVQRVARLDNPVLLLGETGVGKEVIANAIHASSYRSNKSFIEVNCGAIPESLVDSELFGHEKGAFTGAISKKRGRFERAHKGSILLDEIGELPPPIQVRLLRVLQEKEIERVGGTKTIPVNSRIIIATHRNLKKMVRSGTFREDLFYRLNVCPIVIPPLRERREDIPALVYYFIENKSKEMGFKSTPELASGSMKQLKHHEWPGNVRELENVVERALIKCRKGTLKFEGASSFMNKNLLSCYEGSKTEPIKLDKMISMYIQKILKAANGKISGPGGAAESLDIHPNTLRKKMDKLGIAYKRRSN